MNGFLGKSQGNRLPYLMIIALVSIGFLLMIPVSSAETLKVISNTDICKYDVNLGLDRCETVYELCDPTLNMQKVDFRFKTEQDKTLKSQISELNYSFSSKITKMNCREVTISGYKNPYKNVDNVLCYDDKCYEEYVWWNTSFLSKFAINGSVNVGVVTMPLLLNDSFVTIDGLEQYVWCNYTLNTTRGIVGYFYFTNHTFYQCVDRTETFAVGMDVDQGNGTDLNFTYDDDVLFVQHMNDGTTDSSSYSKTASVTGSLADATGQIATAQTFANDFISVTSTNGPTGISPFTISVWFNTISADGILVHIGQVAPTFRSYRLQIAGSKLSFSGFGAGSNLFTTSENVNDGAWHQGIGVFFANDTGFLYLDGVFKGSGSPATSANLNGQDITIGAYDDGNLKFGGEMDEVRIWNRSLSGDEIRAMYENQNGTFNISTPGQIINLSENVSVRHFDIGVPSFLITSQSYQTIINDTFTLVNPVDLIIKGSGGARKIAGGATTSILSARLIFNGVTLFDTNIRSVRGINDRGIFTLPIINTTGSGGINRFVFQMRMTGLDDINVSNLGFHIDDSLTNNNITIVRSLDTLEVNYTSTSFLNIANFTINKTTNSTVLLDINHRFESTSNNIVGNCYLESEQSGERTDTYNRWLQFSGGVGSSGINYRSQISVNGDENWMVFCSSSTNNLMLNNITGYIMNLLNSIDDVNHTINGFQNSTIAFGLTGSNNIIISNDYRNAQGPQLELLVTIMMQSTTGSQDGSDSPVFRVRTNDSVCNITFQRSLASNSDIGTAKVYLNCGGITPGDIRTYEVVVDISAGNTLNILNASLSTYEATPQNVIVGIVPPVVTITSPTNGSTVTETITILSSVFDPSRIGWLSIVDIVNSTGFSLNILNQTTFQNTTSINFNTRNVGNGNYTIIWLVANTQGNNTDNVSVLITNIIIPAPPTISFCVNSELLLTRDSTRTVTNGNETVEVIDRITFCHYGCSNVTISTWGNPGCIESDFSLSLILIAVVLISVLSIRRIL